MSTENKRRALPSVDALLTHPTGAALVREHGHQTVVAALRAALDAARATLAQPDAMPPQIEALLNTAAAHITRQNTPTLRPVINATGVIIHTNLGRAPLADAALAAIREAGGSYSTLEFDLESGKRGSRTVHAESQLRELTGAEAALVVNNNAAALVLVLSALAQGREVIISRGQLVEIGGGFRVPDVMAQSGARLVEVGTTNRTRAADYASAVTDSTALLMRAHASNFKQIGFTEDTPLAQMAAVAHERGLLLVDDLGSGALLDTAQFGLDHEPTVQESLQAGCDVVCFSGDKLLGGPQAGLIVGRQAVIEQLKRHPLARAVRADKLTLAALNATLLLYRQERVLTHVPVWWMMARPLAELQATAARWAAAVGGEVIVGESTVGGGSLPGAMLPTALLALTVASPDAFLTGLRHAETPVIARIAADRILIDPRTVFPEQEAALLRALKSLAGG
jgi:L-seryl-tRNA(Ser) seleniumtransferase